MIPTLTQKLSIEAAGTGLTLSYPEGWSVAPKQFSNMNELINVPAGQHKTQKSTAAIKIRTQTRTDHAEAVHELKEIAAEMDSPSTFLSIGDWPGLQRRHIEQRQQPNEGFRFADEKVLRVTTAVAAGSLLIRIDGILPSNADEKMIGEVEAISRSLVFTIAGNPAQVQKDLENLRNEARQKTPAPPAPATDTSSARSGPSQTRGLSEQSAPGPGAAQRVFTGGNGELEIAVSPNGQTVVIARQNNFRTSNDGGQNFPFSGNLNLGDGDPSLAFGQSGNFYLAGIRFNCQAADAAGPFGYTCTGILRSTNNGQSFTLLSNAAVCPNKDPDPSDGITPVPGNCFPDQEHIAADRVNAALGGDQVYSTWRNFDATDQDPAIVCSQDSGVTWTAPADVDSGFIPRIGVGQDGFVYVVYRSGNNIRINKYSSCANGLAVQPTFPKTITPVTDVACPVPGLDRCNDGNNLSSIMVAVDDTNANHVYVAYANQTAAGNQDVLVRDSLDGGVTWLPARVVMLNSAVSAVRFMPWISTTGGNAFVTWYDRRASTPCPSPPCASNNDLTDYFTGNAGLDGVGNLVAGAELKFTDSADPQCASGWPCVPRATGDSETCSVQPQVAGVCCDATQPGCPGSQQRCDFSSTGCPTGETCNTGGGCPKYGDYNGNAAAAGRLFAAWSSATPPSGIISSGGIDIFFAVSPDFSSDLSITKTDSPDPVTAGNNLTYTVTVTNNGPDTAASVVVTDNLPPQTTFVSCSATGGGACGGSGNNRTATFTSLAPAASAIVTFVVTVNCSLAGGTMISNTATVSSSTPDPDSNNNSATATTTVSNPPPVISNVSVDKPVLWPPNHKLVNETVNYTVTDNCPLPPNSCTLTVSSNEPVNGKGDGNTSPDWIVLDAHHVQLRAERSGKGNGRIYTIGITCVDSGGSSSHQDTKVTVSHDQGKH